jgi:hypothetical protein
VSIFFAGAYRAHTLRIMVEALSLDHSATSYVVIWISTEPDGGGTHSS